MRKKVYNHPKIGESKIETNSIICVSNTMGLNDKSTNEQW